MRKSILLTGAIGVVAIALAVGLSQTDKGKEWFSSYGTPRESTSDAIASAVTTDTNNTPKPVMTQVMTEPPQKTDTTTAATATPAPTADATTTAAAIPAATATSVADTTPSAGADAAQSSSSTGMTPVNLDAAQAKLNAEATVAADAAAANKPVETIPAAPEVEAPKSNFKPDIAAALQDISIGSADAPITVYDFSSLTCPHCGHFHNEVLPKIKADYIDKGKVRWVFHGFPLNEPALKAEMIARCAPKDQYIKLIDLMYQNQERWAFSASPLPNLAMMLKLAGITDDMFNGCTNDKDLQAALLKKIQAEGDKYKIQATPTFVINDGEKNIEGAGSYEGFAFDLDALLKMKEAQKAAAKTQK